MPVAIPVAIAAVGTAGAMVSANSKKKAAQGAANAQIQGFNAASDIAQGIYGQTQGAFDIYQDVGYGATVDLAGMAGPRGELGRAFTLEDFKADPGYQFTMDEALKSIQRTQSGRGGALSGGAMKALQGRAADLGSLEYGKAYDRFVNRQNQNFQQLYNLGNMGMNAVSQKASLGSAYANLLGGYATGTGTAEAGRYTAQGAASAEMASGISKAIGQGLGAYSGLKS